MFPPLLAFGITNLPMLGWLAAAAAPILIHLWRRQEYRETSWAAMQYLLAATKRRSRRLLFEQWFLLAIRTLVVVLVVLAVAEPYMAWTNAALGPGANTHRVLVLDSSYSMAYRPTDKTRFERAKELAQQIVQQSPQGDAFTLVMMSSPPRVVVGTPALEPSAILREIDNLQPVHTGADLPATIRAVRQLVDAASRENPRLVRQEVYFLTDLQRVTWLPKLDAVAAAEYQQQIAGLAELARLVLIDLGQPVTENLAITGLRAIDPLLTVGRNVTLEAALKNFGRQAKRQTVELLVDRRRIERKEINIDADKTASVAFSYRFDAPGDHAIEVCAPGDALDVDNHRFLALSVREAIRVLCIDGRPSGRPFHGAADYLAVALAPGAETSADRAPLLVEVATENAILDRDLASYDCLLLCNVAQFTASEAGVLEAYLQHGGSLVFFLGDQVLADRYNRELFEGGQGMAGQGILPARLGALIDRPPSGLDPKSFRHPILQPFRGRGEAGLLRTPVLKYYKLTVPETSAAKTVLALADGDPLVVEAPVHRGRVVLVATSADRSWTAMPLGPSFLPLVQEIVAWCVGGQVQQRNLLAGDPFDTSSATAASQSGFHQVRSGEKGDSPHLCEAPGGRAPTRSVGRRQMGTVPFFRNETFAVNVDTAESDLTAVEIEELRNTAWSGIPFVHHTSWQDLAASNRPAQVRAGMRLHVGLLYGVLLLLFLETFFGWRLGYHG